MNRFALIAISALSIAASTLAATAAELIMIDQKGCHYCARWTAEIGPIYPKSAEGKFAPLRRINIRSVPEDLDLKSKPTFTPTFILVEDGKELGRLEGYPGEHLFWPMLSELFKTSPEYTDPGS